MKICFKNQIHKISKLPESYQHLVEKASKFYSTQLPSKWAMYYYDAEGDQVMLSTDEDYEVLLETFPKDSSEGFKVNIIPLEDNTTPIFDEGNVTHKMESNVGLERSGKKDREEHEKLASVGKEKESKPTNKVEEEIQEEPPKKALGLGKKESREEPIEIEKGINERTKMALCDVDIQQCESDVTQNVPSS